MATTPNLKCPTCNFPLARSPLPEDRAAMEPVLCRACTHAAKLMLAQEVLAEEPLFELNLTEEDLSERELAEEELTKQTLARKELAMKIPADLLNYRNTWCHPSQVFWGSGVPTRLQSATWDKAQPEVKAAVPTNILDPIQDGFFPKKGFGLLGHAGCGKSGAMAALVRRLVPRMAWRLAATAEDASRLSYDGLLKVRWADWPTTFLELQQHAIDSDFVSNLRRVMVDADLLVLDDLGREALPRVVGDGSMPFGLGVLNLILSGRNAAQKPTWWASNLDLEALGNLYDGSMLDRLMEDNPPCYVDPDAKNLRLPQYQVPEA
jgi:DNA replication protein DnaC